MGERSECGKTAFGKTGTEEDRHVGELADIYREDRPMGRRIKEDRRDN